MATRTKVRHLPRRSGVGARLAIPMPWNRTHPLSMKAAEQRRVAAALRDRVVEAGQ